MKYRFTCCDTPLGNKGAAKSTFLFFMCCEAVTNPKNLSGYGEHWTWLLLRKVFGTLDKAKTGSMKMILSELKYKTTGKWKLLAALFVAPQTNKHQSHQIVVFPAAVQILPFC